VFSILWGIKWWLCQDESCLFGVTSEIVKDASMPELLH
jgi:hypothetical protein